MSKTIKYTSPNGLTGAIGGASSMAIYDKDGREVFHIGFRSINTEEELKKFVDGFPEWMENLRKLTKEID